MEILLTIIKYLVFGFAGLIGLLVVVVMLFGKRIHKRWEFEADFRDATGREFGEFEIQLSRIEKEEPEDTLKAKLRLRHPSLVQHATVQVFIDDTLVLEKMVEKEGRIYVRTKDLVNPVDSVTAGQVCRVVVGGTVIASAGFHPD
ncbi:MAG: hypothetical protein QNI96_13960 [Woeseiaceae bacterium]|nr:hypothetical protein [Woeseiaceae bacterium]